jgi:hypothetical protein
MMVPAAESISRINHSGNPETFELRLRQRLQEMLRKVGDLDGMLKTLGDIAFDAESLVGNHEINKQLFGVINGMKRTICDGEQLQLNYPNGASAEDKRMIQLLHDATVATNIPKYFAGEHSKRVFASTFRDSASVFDLLTVFTEYAKDKPPSQKLGIEERTGRLAKYISDNKKNL